jgi:nucleotide-binding universal stress UspA family protein
LRNKRRSNNNKSGLANLFDGADAEHTMKCANSLISSDSPDAHAAVGRVLNQHLLIKPLPKKDLIIKSIFHPTDFSEGDQGAFAHALKLAIATRAHLTLLHAGADADSLHWSNFPHVRETLERWKLLSADRSRHDLAKLGLRVEKTEKTERDPVRATLDYLAENKPDLIVLSTHQRHGLSRWLHKAIAEPIASQSHTLTLFVPEGVPGFVSSANGNLMLSNILIPVASSPSPQHAVEAAFALPSLLGCSDVHYKVLHAGPRESLVQVNADAFPGCIFESTACKGNIVDDILAVSRTQKSDLIVMATAGHQSFLDGLRGSITEQVVREARCPVLAVPSVE